MTPAQATDNHRKRAEGDYGNITASKGGIPGANEPVRLCRCRAAALPRH